MQPYASKYTARTCKPICVKYSGLGDDQNTAKLILPPLIIIIVLMNVTGLKYTKLTVNSNKLYIHSIKLCMHFT